MKRSTVLVILIGIVVFTTLVALLGGSIAQSYLYNNIWLANGNETPECLSPYDNSFTCPHTDPEYYHGFYWSNRIMTISILIAGTVFGLNLYRRRTEKITKKTTCHHVMHYHIDCDHGFFHKSFQDSELL